MATKSIDEQIAEHEAAIKQLKQTQLTAYEQEYETVSARARELRDIISGIKGEPAEKGVRGRKPKAEKVQGKLVSVDRLKEVIKTAGGTLNIRKEGYDLPGIKKHVENLPKVFKLGGKSPWFTVSLA